MKPKKLLAIIAAVMLSGCAANNGEIPAPETVSVSETETVSQTEELSTIPETTVETSAATVKQTSAPETESTEPEPTPDPETLPPSGNIYNCKAESYTVKCTENFKADRGRIFRSKEELSGFLSEAMINYSNSGGLIAKLGQYDDSFFESSLLYICGFDMLYFSHYSYSFENAIYSSEKNRVTVTYKETEEEEGEGNHAVTLTEIPLDKVADSSEIIFELTSDDYAPAILTPVSFKGEVYELEYSFSEAEKGAFPKDKEDVYSAALSELKRSDECIRMSQVITDNAGSGRYDNIKTDEDGIIIPQLTGYIIKDLNGDGEDEYFLLFDMPTDSMHNTLCSHAVFVGSDGVVRLPENGSGMEGELVLINYKDFSHVMITFGVNNATNHSEIYAVSENIPRHVYTGGCIVEKADGFCFESTLPQMPYDPLFFYNSDLERYACLSPEPLDEALAQELYQSEAFQSSFYVQEISSPEELTERFGVLGGKYISNTDANISFVRDSGGFEENPYCVGELTGYYYFRCTSCTADIAELQSNMIKLD